MLSAARKPGLLTLAACRSLSSFFFPGGAAARRRSRYWSYVVLGASEFLTLPSQAAGEKPFIFR